MNRFRRATYRQVPGINTASLPDLVFTLLFFFLIVANMKDDKSTITLRMPTASEVQEAENTDRVITIYVGQPTSKEGDSPIQIYGKIVRLEELTAALESEKERINAGNASDIIVFLKVDKHTKMGTVADIKQKLRESGLLVVNYITERKYNNENKDSAIH